VDVDIDQYSHLFVKSFGWFENPESIFITMEHIDLRDLQRQLTGPIPETEAQQICSQLLHGVQCLHDNKFVHRDLKPQVGHLGLTGSDEDANLLTIQERLCEIQRA
jgi:serine/threonine protein kinase